MNKIVTNDNSNAVLRALAEKVPVADILSPEIQGIIQDMSTALRDTDDGIGIAAPQIGVSKQIFIASEEALFDAPEKMTPEAEKKTKKDWKHYVFINPKIVTISKSTVHDAEGCLSVPGTYGLVTRAEKIKIRGLNEHGEKVERGASGLFARLFQHEMDHLRGVLFIDKAEDLHEI